MEGQQTGVGWSVAGASADRECAQRMEGEEGSCKDCPIFDFKGVLEFGATLAWRSSKLISEDFSVASSAHRDVVLSFGDMCDVVLDSF